MLQLVACDPNVARGQHLPPARRGGLVRLAERPLLRRPHAEGLGRDGARLDRVHRRRLPGRAPPVDAARRGGRFATAHAAGRERRRASSSARRAGSASSTRRRTCSAACSRRSAPPTPGRSRSRSATSTTTASPTSRPARAADRQGPERQVRRDARVVRRWRSRGRRLGRARRRQR